MSNSYRIRTQVGVDKSIKVTLDQDFEFLEVLSLKLLQNEIYTRQCADYGVVIGRISINNGFGLPNCRVSIFIPLTSQDATNPIISELYPYKSLSDVNDDGYRYNLLPYTKSYSAHVPTGTFFDKEDVLINQSYIEVFDKYYRYTAITNDSGDFMIFGVPLGVQTIHVDVDLSDIGEFSLAPQDLIRTGLATEAQVAGTRFKASNNLNELPQIISINRIINVEPLWGQPEICEIGINRTDFDLSAESNVVIEPTAIFMGSIFSDTDNLALRSNCRPKLYQGELCSLQAGPGEILAIRQTIDNDAQGRPILEQFELESGGQVIDDNGTWLLDLPMNLDYVTTNEFGERVISNDPEVGIPTRGKYRFKIKWNQSPKLDENVKRGYFLVPNVREYGWANSNLDPLINLSPGFPNYDLAKKSYAFSLSWDDYADPNSAINCEDTFYQFSYNKVYTVSQLIDQYRKGILSNRILGIKNILDPACESENNKFPTNDSFFRWDFIFLLFTILGYIIRPILLVLVVVLHVLFIVLDVLKVAFPLLIGYLLTLGGIAISEAIASGPSFALIIPFILRATVFILAGTALTVATIFLFRVKLRGINLPLLLYDQCEFCSCPDGGDIEGSLASSGNRGQGLVPPAIPNISGLQLTNFEGGLYNSDLLSDYTFLLQMSKLLTGTYIQYSPNDTVCYSKTPFYTIGPYESCGDPCTFGGYFPTQPNTPVQGNLDCVINKSTQQSFFFTTSITIAERINLFNTKAKYFNNQANNNSGCDVSSNPGGGVNRIKVSIDPITNGGLHHFDNVVCILMTPESLSNLEAGTMITFIDPTKTKDINCTGGTLNQFENNAIIGTSATPLGQTTKTIDIFYANPNGNGNIGPITYTIPAPSSADTNFHKFPTDIEYFQVITAMTVTKYNTLTNVLAYINSRYSLPERYINNSMMNSVLWDKNRDHQVNHMFKPIESLENGEEQIIVFLNRGVDPYSTRVNIKFGLGILFGYSDGQEDSVYVEGEYKLNIPIQGKYLNVNHDTLQITSPNVRDSKAIDPYANITLYYKSFDYRPSISSSSPYSAFTSNLASFYSSLKGKNALDGNLNLNPAFNCDTSTACLSPNEASYNNTYGAKVRGVNGTNGNYYTQVYFFSFDNGGLFECIRKRSNYPFDQFGNNLKVNYGYFPGEIVEGGSLMSTKFRDEQIVGTTDYNFKIRTGYSSEFPPDPSFDWFQKSSYFAPKYSSGLTLNYPLGIDNCQIVMRSDRLPTSDRLLFSCNNYYSLQQNQNLGIYIIPDEGTLNLTTTPNIGVGPLVETGFIGNSIATLLNSTNNCNDSRNLECYDFTPNGLLRDTLTRPGGGTYYTNTGNCQKFADKFIFENGCYKLITTPLISLPKDLLLVSEWFSRLNITFGACRNVFSHLFVSNWVNGGLYAFAFKNNRVLDGNGQLTSEVCKDVIFFDKDTNNFFYRSSPFNTGTTLNPMQEFIGKRADPTLGVPINRNLLYPTTIMDLGPRNDYIQELIYSDEYDGYVVNNIGTTTYKDVSDLLNLLILTRLANTSFVSLMIGAQGASIFNYFTRVGLFNPRQRRFVDADYAQTISVNSELGVIGFEPESYANIDISQSYVLGPPPPQAFAINPVYFNTGDGEDVVFGIFYSSDTQVRDFITPKRTIINGQVLANNPCAFNNFYCYSQEVPLYQWKMNQNRIPENDSIFGSQTNDWYTTPIGSGFLKSKYQSLDRANITSRYFRTNDASSFYVENDKGYIFSKDTRNWDETPIPPPATDSIFWTPDSYNPLITGQDSNNNPESRIITVGAPFYFYFGLKKGKSAWDRFAKKWINFENIN